MIIDCPHCEGRGVVFWQAPVYCRVTRDMAIDAGDLSMEGSEIQWGTEEAEEPCQRCNGTGKIEASHDH